MASDRTYRYRRIIAWAALIVGCAAAWAGVVFAIYQHTPAAIY